MIVKIALTFIMGTFFFLGGATNAIAGPNGAVLAKKCERCHGKNGNSSKEQVPSIAGLSTTYFLDTMKDFRRGKRPSKKFKTKGHKETDMNHIAKRLSKEELIALGDYLVVQTFLPHQQSFSRTLARKGQKIYKKRCRKCHTDNGSNPDDDAGRLAGQWILYLDSQLTQFSSGKRKPPKKMKKQLKKLKKGDIPALLHFFASQH